MIWVLVLLSLNLPLGRVTDDEIAAIVFTSREECLREKAVVDAYVAEKGQQLNMACLSANNTLRRAPAASASPQSAPATSTNPARRS